MKTNIPIKVIANREFVKASILLVLLFAFIPLLSNDAVDPWGVIAPRRIVGLFTVILTIQFAGFVFIQLFGETRGVYLAGFLGGLVSSTAVHYLAAEKIKLKRNTKAEILGECFMAVTASIALMIFIVGYSSTDLLKIVLVPVLALVSTLALFTLLQIRAHKHRDHQTHKQPSVLVKGAVTSPLEFKKALQFAVVLVGVLFMIGFIRSRFTAEAVMVASFLTGLFELHGISMSLTAGIETMVPEGLQKISAALGLACIASILSKGIIVVVFCRNRFSIYLLANYALACAFGFMAWYFAT